MRHLTVIAFILLIVCHSEVVSQPCPTGTIYFTTQSQIDSFPIHYPNCTEIAGSVAIWGEDITNLDGLSLLTSIEGDLGILSNDALASLSGLDNMTSIGGCLEITNNDALTSLSGLDNVTSIGIFLSIRDNYALTSLSGLDNVTSIGGDLFILENDILASLSGLNIVTFVGGNLWIHDNAALINLSGLDNVTTIGGDFWIAGNDALTSLSGLDNVTSIGGYLWIRDNYALTSLSNLENLTSIGGDLWILSNDALASLSGLENIESGTIEDLYLRFNGLLATCEIESICNYLLNPNGSVYIDNNALGCNTEEEVLTSCESIGIPEMELEQQLSVYPNPFTTSTTIEYELTEPTHIQLTIYNHLGEAVEEAVSAFQLPGVHTYVWSAQRLSEGMYFAVIRSGDGVSVVKMIKQ